MLLGQEGRNRNKGSELYELNVYFFKPLRKAAVLNSLSEVARSLLPGGLQCQLPASLFTVLGGGPAINGVHGLPFALGHMTTRHEVDPSRTQALPGSRHSSPPGGGLGEVASLKVPGIENRGTRCARERTRVPGAEEVGWKGGWQ